MLTALLVLAAGYGFAALFAWFEANGFIFQPKVSGYKEGEGLLRVQADDGVPLACVFRETPGARHTVFYLHGNGEDLADCQEAIDGFVAHGFSVFACDYRGYGLTPGAPCEQRIHADTRALYRYLVDKRGVPPDRLIVYGRSVGSGPAVELAVNQRVAALILEGAFISAFRVVTRVPLFPFDRFRNARKISRLACPLLVVHAVNDQVVPYWHGQTLFAAAPEPKTAFWSTLAHHNNIIDADADAYWAAIMAFAEKLK